MKNWEPEHGSALPRTQILACALCSRDFMFVKLPMPPYVIMGFAAGMSRDRVVHGYMVGLGAANAKMLRLAKRRLFDRSRALAWRWLAKHPVVDLNHRRHDWLGFVRSWSAFGRGLLLLWMRGDTSSRPWMAATRASEPSLPVGANLTALIPYRTSERAQPRAPHARDGLRLSHRGGAPRPEGLRRPDGSA